MKIQLLHVAKVSCCPEQQGWRWNVCFSSWMFFVTFKIMCSRCVRDRRQPLSAKPREYIKKKKIVFLNPNLFQLTELGSLLMWCDHRDAHSFVFCLHWWSEGGGGALHYYQHKPASSTCHNVFRKQLVMCPPPWSATVRRQQEFNPLIWQSRHQRLNNATFSFKANSEESFSRHWLIICPWKIVVIKRKQE